MGGVGGGGEEDEIRKDGVETAVGCGRPAGGEITVGRGRWWKSAVAEEGSVRKTKRRKNIEIK